MTTSRKYGKPNQVFQFLLKHADQGDLDIVKKKYEYEECLKFRQAIDKALETAPPTGSRHLRPIERVRVATNVLAAIGHGGLVPDTIDIIAEYAATDDTLSMAMNVLDRFRDPAIPIVISAMIAEYIGGADVIAGDK